ncbi:MAG: glycosyltransferase family 1 protein, partial [Bacillota bacterium]|nr:glycosyltransferase family 1 protein [Bacillota bacterium]
MKKKVLQIIGVLTVGGAETVAMNLFRYINKDIYEFHYIVFGDKIGSSEAEMINMGAKIFHVNHPSSNYFIYCRQLDQIIKENGPYEIVHSHTLFNSGFVMKIAAENGVKCRITHSHTTQNKVNSSMILKIYEKVMRYLIIKYSTHYAACSKAAGNYLFGEELFRREGIIIKNGIDAEKFKFNNDIRRIIRKDLNISDCFVIGYVGHLAAVKNLDFLLDVFKQIHMVNPSSVLLLAGDGNERIKLENKIKEFNLEANVIMTGNIVNVNEMLSAMDVFVFPSLFGGLGTALIEAQANGLPCIVSDSIPDDAIITDLIKTISLNNDIKLWADT